MVYSMTGFATTTATVPTSLGPITTTITLKTLNNRFFDMNCKLPYTFTQLEVPIIKRCREVLLRGTVYCTVHVNNPQALKSAAMASTPLARGYLEAINKLQKDLGIQGSITISDFIQLPHLFEVTEELQLTDGTNTVMEALEKLLSSVQAARKTEGAILAQDLTQRMTNIQQEMGVIEPRATQVEQERSAQLINDIKETLAAAPAPLQEAHLQALYASIEKIDVHEEIVRFKSHRANFLTTLENNQAEKGKKLDFILQEMFREINTLSAKLGDSTVGNSVVTIKVELEKAREQVQNIV